MNAASTNTKNTLNVQPSTLADWLNKKMDVHILDIRPTKERQEWSIPESHHADLYEDIKSDSENPFSDLHLPDDQPIVTVCGAGKTSRSAAQLLRKQGYEAYSLEGGMKRWNFAWSTAEYQTDQDTTIIQVRRPAKGCLSYLVGSGDEAIVIDASLNPEVYRKLAEERGWNITHAMDTHLHADFVSRSRELASAAGIPYLLHQTADADYSFSPVEDGEHIHFGNSRIQVLHTPGHTPESVSYRLEDQVLFTGDTLFTDGVGRPDLKASRQKAMQKANELYDSLQRLISFEGETLVFPAHVGRSIPFNEPVITETIDTLTTHSELLSLSREAFREESIARIPPTPENYKTISTINRSGRPKEHSIEDLEAGGNRCAVS